MENRIDRDRSKGADFFFMKSTFFVPFGSLFSFKPIISQNGAGTTSPFRISVNCQAGGRAMSCRYFLDILLRADMKEE